MTLLSSVNDQTSSSIYHAPAQRLVAILVLGAIGPSWGVCWELTAPTSGIGTDHLPFSLSGRLLLCDFVPRPCSAGPFGLISCPCFPAAFDVAQLASHLPLHVVQLPMYLLPLRDNRLDLPTHIRSRREGAPLVKASPDPRETDLPSRELTVWWEKQTHRPTVPAPILCGALR